MQIRIRLIRKYLRYVLISAIVYFCFDYFIQITRFLQCYSFVGLKSFLPMTLGLNFGIYGVLGELIAVSIVHFILNTGNAFFIQEIVIIVVFGFGAWFLWHIQSRTHRIHFKYLANFIRYILLSTFLSLVCAAIGVCVVNIIAFEETLVWNISMDILVGMPVNIIYAGLMNLNPVLPPIYINGKRIKEKNDVLYTVDNKIESFQMLNERIEEVLIKNKIDIKKTFIIQNLVEEIYLRIMKRFPNAVIDIKANCDVDFSIEFIYINEKYNPFISSKDEEAASEAGLKIIKHKALLAFYNYLYGENNVHVVI